jgi:hypothetical protein
VSELSYFPLFFFKNRQKIVTAQGFARGLREIVEQDTKEAEKEKNAGASSKNCTGTKKEGTV